MPKRKTPPPRPNGAVVRHLARGPVQRALSTLLLVLQGRSHVNPRFEVMVRELRAVLAAESSDLAAAMTDLLDDVDAAYRLSDRDGDDAGAALCAQAQRHVTRVIQLLTSIDPMEWDRFPSCVWLAMREAEAPLGAMFAALA